MTAAPYCSTRSLIIGQRPLTNRRIVEGGLETLFLTREARDRSVRATIKIIHVGDA